MAELWKRAHPDHPHPQPTIEHEMTMRKPKDPFWQISVWKDQQVIGLTKTT